ncbi:MAG: hypothetical protein LBR44_00525 [Clostridiales Family XIII bacterium]|nr:hypothetical protein [Clostridiales Family XIII bacterium]
MLGLVSLVGGIVTVAFTLGLVGIVCGIIGIVVARKNAARYKTTAGCVLSIIGIILCAIIAVSFLVLLKLMPDSLGAYYLRDVISFLCFTPQA